MSEQRTNVLYLTTECNLSCLYCYEHLKKQEGDFEDFTVTKKQIDDFVTELELQEGDINNTTVVVMGGEPTLALEEFDYLCTKLNESGEKLEKTYYGCFTTNGVKMYTEKGYNEIMDLIKKHRTKHIQLELEISYDRSAHDQRIYHNGKSSREHVETVLKRLNKEKSEFCISCTVTEKNWDILLEEAIYMLEENPYCTKLSFSFAYELLDNYFQKPYFGEQIKEEYMAPMRELYLKYKVPICGLACGEGYCELCDNSNFAGNRYLSPTKGILIADSTTYRKFNQF